MTAIQSLLTTEVDKVVHFFCCVVLFLRFDLVLFLVSSSSFFVGLSGFCVRFRVVRFKVGLYKDVFGSYLYLR